MLAQFHKLLTQKQQPQTLLNDERGFVVSAELILIATVLCLGMVVGLTEVSRAVTGELVDVANGYNRINHGGRYAQLSWNSNNNQLVEVHGSAPVAESQ